MFRTFAFMAFLAALTSLAGNAAMAFDTRPEVDVGKYAGLWYEIARTPNRFQDNTPRRGGERLSACFNTTAEYAVKEPARIAVTNICYREAEGGAVRKDVARGVALVMDEGQNRRLQVAFGPWVARLFQRAFGSSEGNYEIHCLGPEIDGRYSWSVVSGGKDMMWLLARERTPPEDVKSAMRACARKADLPVGKLIYARRTKNGE